MKARKNKKIAVQENKGFTDENTEEGGHHQSASKVEEKALDDIINSIRTGSAFSSGPKKKPGASRNMNDKKDMSKIGKKLPMPISENPKTEANISANTAVQSS